VRFPVNTLIVRKNIDDAFLFVFHIENYAALLEDELGAKIVLDRKGPVQMGQVIKMMLSADDGPLLATLKLVDYDPPRSFQYDLSAIGKAKSNGEELVPISFFADKVSVSVEFQEVAEGTRIRFKTSTEGRQGLLMQALVYLMIALPSWFSHRRYLDKLGRLMEREA
jgi:hypothetical protein